MRPLRCLAWGQGDIEAEFVELSSKAGPVGAVEMISPKVGISETPPTHSIRGREDGGGNRDDGLAWTTPRLERPFQN
jgi:hypothetical protein